MQPGLRMSPVAFKRKEMTSKKLKLGKKGEMKRHGGWTSAYVKPSGKFWKRYFNKKVRRGAVHKRGNWHEWC